MLKDTGDSPKNIDKNPSPAVVDSGISNPSLPISNPAGILVVLEK